MQKRIDKQEVMKFAFGSLEVCWSIAKFWLRAAAAQIDWDGYSARQQKLLTKYQSCLIISFLVFVCLGTALFCWPDLDSPTRQNDIKIVWGAFLSALFLIILAVVIAFVIRKHSNLNNSEKEEYQKKLEARAYLGMAIFFGILGIHWLETTKLPLLSGSWIVMFLVFTLVSGILLVVGYLKRKRIALESSKQ